MSQGKDAPDYDHLDFERGLKSLLGLIDRRDPLVLLALADVSGLAAHVGGWVEQVSDRGVQVDAGGSKPLRDLLNFWNRARAAAKSDDLFDEVVSFSGYTTAHGLAYELMKPLAIIGHADVAVGLATRMVDEGFPVSPDGLVLDIGVAGAWDHVVAFYEGLQQKHGFLGVSARLEGLLWKHVYHQGFTETVLPRLAALRHDPDAGYSDFRRWQALAYRIRAGRRDLDVPLLSGDEQTHGYRLAAAMQIAALENDVSRRDYVQALRSNFREQSIGIFHVDRGVTLDLELTSKNCLAERIMLAARQKDYALVEELTGDPPGNALRHPADIAIEAFIEERDWRGALVISKKYDIRTRDIPDWSDDTRGRDYLTLQKALATAAILDGEDQAAGHFLANIRHGRATLPEPRPRTPLPWEQLSDEPSWDELGVVRVPLADHAPDASEPEIARSSEELREDLWSATVLAGISQGRLPRSFASVLLPVFTDPY